MEYLKPKSASKVVLPKGQILRDKILKTMDTIASVVGGTLGPGGHPVLIERSEYNLPPTVTKDGVTVFRSLGFDDPVAHCIMEAARDASVRTAVEAGDGTTTATVLAEAFVRLTEQFCRANPMIPPQVVIQRIKLAYKETLEPEIGRLAINCDLSTDEGLERLKAIATISGNGDTELADSVMECFGITGDDGNVTIIESSGASRYEVEKIEGYPVPMGYEESCAKFYSAFINDVATQRVVLDKPVFVLYFGRVTEIQTLMNLMQRLQEGWSANYLVPHNVVIFATGYSESVLASLANNFLAPGSINIFPMVVPHSPISNGQRQFLDDLAAVTGSRVFDPITAPLDDAKFEDLGNIAIDQDNKWQSLGISNFECGRYRSTIVGFADEEKLLQRADEVRSALEFSESELDTKLTQERLAKLTGGIAKLKVIGSSTGELRERRDRAEDAVCAVRGAIAHGAIIGGGYGLARLAILVSERAIGDLNKQIMEEILCPALLAPIRVLYDNAGVFTENDIWLKKILGSQTGKDIEVINVQTGETVNALKAGILDSVPAVKEAIKNSISIATLLGTLGGCVVFPRDHEVDKNEARDNGDFLRNANVDPNDGRI